MRILLISPIFNDNSIDSILMRRFARIIENIGAELLIVSSSAGNQKPCLDDKNVVTDALQRLPRFHPISLLGMPRRIELPGYIEAAVSAAIRWNSKGKIDLVISRYVPFHAHEAAIAVRGHILSRWVSMYHDPFPPFFIPQGTVYDGIIKHPIQHYLMRRMARRYYKGADGWAFPSERMGAYISKKIESELGCSPRPIYTVVHPPPLASELPEKNCEEKFVVRYIGTVGWGRDFRAVLKGWCTFIAKAGVKFRECRLEIIGPAYNISRLTTLFAKNWPPPIEEQIHTCNHFGTVIRVKEAVTHARAIQLSTDATMSLHVDADFKENIYLAGKLAELVAMGKTILAITPSLSACRDYLGNQARVDCVAPNDEMKIAECFLKRYKEWEKCNRGSIDYRYINQTVFSASSVDTQVKKLLLGEND